jgi:hypothetical protein
VKASDGYRVHNLSTGLNYTMIQEAVDASETLGGHTSARAKANKFILEHPNVVFASSGRGAPFTTD